MSTGSRYDKDSQRWCDLLNESRAIELELIEARAALSEIVRLGEGMPEDSREAEIAKNFLENDRTQVERPETVSTILTKLN